MVRIKCAYSVMSIRTVNRSGDLDFESLRFRYILTHLNLRDDNNICKCRDLTVIERCDNCTELKEECNKTLSDACETFDQSCTGKLILT